MIIVILDSKHLLEGHIYVIIAMHIYLLKEPKQFQTQRAVETAVNNTNKK